LSKDQIKLARDLATKRNAKSARFGSKTYNDKHKSEDVHFMGVLSELAVALVCKTKLDTNIYNNKGDEGFDLVLPKLGRCNVKTTTYKDDPFLRVEVNKFKECVDSYILCVWDKNKSKEVQIIGYATKMDILKAPQKRLMRYGPLNYILTEKDLKSLKVVA